MPLGSVALVGAGPGDPGLITVRGHALLRGADVVVYDRLVSPALLASARRDAELIDAGKPVAGASARVAASRAAASRGRGAGARGSSATETQRWIEGVLIARARAGASVVRLKGGDPFVFGRGGEEAEALAAAGIPFEIVPGVSAAVAGPAVAGIPVTHRDRSASVAIATAHRADGSGADWRAFASADTVVVLMGAERIEDVARGLIAAGKPAPTPAAVIEDATLPTQRTVCAPLSKLPSAARAAGIRAPSVIVCGDVVSLREVIGGWDTRPLSGRRVLVTRSREQASELSSILRELGAQVVEAPAIRIEPPKSWTQLDRAIGKMETFEWLVFTSANGVRAFVARLRAARKDARALAGVKVCAIGPGTADALGAIGIVPDLVPQSYTTNEVARAFPRGTGRVLLARADIAEPALEEALARKGWHVTRAVAYRIAGAQRMDPDVRRAIVRGEIDAITFASSGTVRAFSKLLKGAPHPNTKIVCIGSVAAKEARAAGLRVTKTAKPHTIPALAAAVVDAVGSRAPAKPARKADSSRRRTKAR
jgi:uroporphyrinogen III methyltransferase/synthase